MNVKQLKELLNRCPEDANVWIEYPSPEDLREEDDDEDINEQSPVAAVGLDENENTVVLSPFFQTDLGQMHVNKDGGITISF